MREVVEGAAEAGIGILSLFALSTEDWRQPGEDGSALMGLLELYARTECEELRRQGVEVHVLGDVDRVDDSTRSAIDKISKATRGGRALRLNLMISYGGREDILRATRLIVDRVHTGGLAPEEIDQGVIEAALFTDGLPSPDLLIRTSGERRTSNVMLWQLAYTELHLSSVLWPDFGRDDLFDAVLDFQGRERRFGRVMAT